jgi:hypothetical protein
VLTHPAIELDGIETDLSCNPLEETQERHLERILASPVDFVSCDVVQHVNRRILLPGGWIEAG